MVPSSVLSFLLPLALVSGRPVPDADAGFLSFARQTTSCAEYIVIFARGTSETGTLGSIVGPPLQSALESLVGASNVNVTGVSYDADVAGFLEGGDSTGSTTMADMVTEAVADCPDSNVVMSGYSQGAQLVHNAASQISADTASQVSSAVTFGDPDNPDAVAQIDKQKIYCASGDNICEGGVIISTAHLSYGSNASDAADFIVSSATSARKEKK